MENWDYSMEGIYFVTICTSHMQCYFGNVAQAKMTYSNIGKIAKQYWEGIPEHFPYAILDEHVVMPNHIHGIIAIPNQPDIKKAPKTVETALLEALRATPLHDCDKLINAEMSRISPKAGSLSSIIRSYKSAVTNYANEQSIPFKWHPRFHDHIIRNEKSLRKIQEYIRNNIYNWKDDCYFSG